MAAANVEAQNLVENIMMGFEIGALLICGLIGTSQCYGIYKNYKSIKKTNKYKDFLNENKTPQSINQTIAQLENAKLNG